MRWQSAIKRLLPILILVPIVPGGVHLYNSRSSSAEEAESGSPLRQVNVVLADVRMMEFQRVLVLQGNVQAKVFAMVSPRIPGVLDVIFVDDGDEVEAGETRLFQTDSLKLAKALEVAKHEVAVADSSLREKQASLEENQAEYDKAKYDWERCQEMREKGVVANDEIEEDRAEYRKSAAVLKHAKALIALAEAQQQQAGSRLEMAQKDLDDSLVKAPISGRVSKRFQEPGEMGNPGQPVLRIEDPSVVEVSAFLPAQAYGQVTPGQTAMHLTVNGVDLGEQTISYKSPTIDRKLRTFETQCVLHDPPAAVAPGAMAHVRIILERRQGLGVPADAIQHRGGQPVVFLADDQMARMIPVEVGLEMDGFTEIASQALSESTEVVVEGGFFLNPNSPIRVLREGQ
ncbi:MAG: efflux RND transporter periplasmic adaptor subunit [Phycisphaerae bacterium]|nr:efflux RND transporter periplasmic adaptor subunit [Phycisphaerae bacterium]